MRARQVVLVSVLSSLFTMAAVAGLTLLMLPGWRAHVALDPQTLRIRLPDGAPVTVAITEPIDTELDTVIDVQFPIDEVLPLKFDAPLLMDIEIDAQVPMQTVIRYESVLPLDADVTAHILGVPVNVPVSGNIPVKLYVPVDQLVPIKFKAPVKVSMDEALQVPVKLDFNTRIPIKQSLHIPVNKPLETNILMSDHPVRVEMIDAEVVMPLDAVRLQRKHAPEPTP